MPHSKDIRCGEGWYDFNVNSFYDYLDTQTEEVVINSPYTGVQYKYYENELHQQMEELANQYINWCVFNREGSQVDDEDLLPHTFTSMMPYIYYHLKRWCKNNCREASSVYIWRSTLPPPPSKPKRINLKYICCICDKKSKGYGNNPSPIKTTGRCCDMCNLRVIKVRLAFADAEDDSE